MGSVSVYDQMKDILDEYVDRVDDVSGDCAASAAKKTASKIKDTAARKTGEYAKGWRSKKTGDKSYTAYNATMPGLTHLLEYGHAIVNKKGYFGRVNGDHKIADAEQWGINEFESEIRRKLQ